jgi:hypothetical protein
MAFSDQNLIFLISQQRAGSTLLQRMLGGHPSIHTTAETWLMLPLVYATRESGYQAEYNAVIGQKGLQDFLNTLDAGTSHYNVALRQMALSLYGTAVSQANKQFFLDKTPRYYYIIPDLLTIFPQAHFIFLIRNPLAVLASILNTWVKEHWVLLARYRDDLLAAPEKLLAGIAQAGDRGFVVHYEALVQQPEKELQRLCTFLSLPYHKQMTQYGAQEKPAGDLGDATQIEKRQGPTKTSLYRWHKLAEGAQTHHFALAYLRELGPVVVGNLGYDFAELEAKLTAVSPSPASTHYTWQQLMYPDDRQQKRQQAIEFALLQHRRLAHYLKKWRKRIFAK